MNFAKFLRTPLLQSASGGCFCKVINLKSFCNSYTKFVIVDIKFRFTCGKSDLFKNRPVLKFQKYTIFVEIGSCSYFANLLPHYYEISELKNFKIDIGKVGVYKMFVDPLMT